MAGKGTQEFQLGFDVVREELVVNHFASIVESSGLVQDGLSVQSAIIHHPHWSVLPAGEVLLALFNKQNRQAYWADVAIDNWQIGGAEKFERGMDLTDMAGAVVITPPLTQLDCPWFSADLAAICQGLPHYSGPVYVIEQKSPAELHQHIEFGWREDCLKDPHLGLADIDFHVNRGKDWLFWTARRKLERDQTVWNEVMKYFRAKRAVTSQLGIHTFESLGGRLIIEDWGPYGERVSRIGEIDEGEVLKQIGFRLSIKLPELSEKAKRLRTGLMNKASQEKADLEKPLLLPGKIVLASRCINSDYHPGEEPLLTRTCYWLEQKRGRWQMHIEVSCPHCGLIDEPSVVLVKSHKRWINSQWVKGWVWR